jgi:predicted RNA-binding Zn ribbon-like protein
MVMSKLRQAPGELERVRQFVNTRQIGHVTDRIAKPRALAVWLEEQRLAPPGIRATRADVAHAVALREALREMLVAHNNGVDPPPGACQVLDDSARRGRLRLRFSDDGGASITAEAGGVNGALGRLVATVHDSIAHGTWDRLKACREHECEWAFYDHTKNRSGAWCSMERCGNRAKARAHRERHGAHAGG